MPRPTNSLLVQLRGTVAGGSSRYSCSWAMSPPDDPPELTTGFAAALLARLDDNGFSDGQLNLMNNNDTWIDLIVYQYNASNAVIGQSLTPVNRTGLQTIANPKSTACVLTLRTALLTRSGRGRIYLPATGAGIGGATGRFMNQYVQDCLDGIDDLRVNPVLGSQPQVYSPTDGVSRNVNRVDADTIPDRVEHRERGLVRSRLIGQAD